MKKVITLSVVLAGFTAMVSQIIFIRELLVVFYGNELTIGFILANWLVCGALGSALLGGLADKARNKTGLFAACQVALALIIPLSIAAIRAIRSALGVNPGEIMPFSPMITSSLVVVAPVCIILGFVFALACKIYAHSPGRAAVDIGRVYILEAVGAMAGGLLTGLVLIRLMRPVRIAVLVALLNLLLAAFLVKANRKAVLAILLIAAAIFGSCGSMDEYSTGLQWRGQNLLGAKNSIYGNVAVTEKDGQLSFFDNGLHLYTVPDKASAEEAVHFALLEHSPDPKDVLLVGGGAGGAIEECLREPIARLDYVELDPLVIDMAKAFLPRDRQKFFGDPRVRVHNDDGRHFVKTTDRMYDCIILNIGDPSTAQINRYYTKEFFEELRNKLKKGGIVSFAVTSSESYVNDPLGVFLSSIYRTVKSVFADVLVIPGERAVFLISAEKGRLARDYITLENRASGRGLGLKYIRDYYLFSRMSVENMNYMESVLARHADAGINRDFKPVTYFYYISFWTAQFRGSLFGYIQKAATAKNIWIALACICLVAAYSARRAPAFTAVTVCGFSMMAMQVMALLAFQIIYGYLFYKIGMILASFMAGMVLGGWYMISVMPALKNDKPVFKRIQGAISLYAVLLPAAFGFFGSSSGSAVSWFGANIAFLLIPAAAGFLGGAQFPLAGRIALKTNPGLARTAGALYGFDLAGSCLGAVLTTAILVPVIGFFNTCLAISAINFIVFLAL